MKTCIIIFLLIIQSSIFAQENYILNNYERGELLKEIDNICGDTWCEGDFDFSFNDLKCLESTGLCNFKFEYIHTEWGNEYETSDPIFKIRIPKVCILEDFKSKDDLITSKKNYYISTPISFTDKLYDAVSDCIDQNIGNAYNEVDKELKKIKLRKN